jgi:hypothetical protein
MHSGARQRKDRQTSFLAEAGLLRTTHGTDASSHEQSSRLVASSLLQTY